VQVGPLGPASSDIRSEGLFLSRSFEFVPTPFLLAVGWVLDRDPASAGGIVVLRTSGPFRHSPLYIEFASNSFFAGGKAALPMLTISFCPSTGQLVGAGHRLGGYSAPHCLPPDASAQASPPHAKAARLPGT
jgi:hypothetical protein